MQLVTAQDHPLFEYVQRPDDTFAFEEIVNYPGSDHVVHVLNMTSQTWMDGTWTNKHIRKINSM